jgi:hypothetical protein
MATTLRARGPTSVFYGLLCLDGVLVEAPGRVLGTRFCAAFGARLDLDDKADVVELQGR